MNDRLTVEDHLGSVDRTELLASDARTGLTAAQKRLSPVWFYDERGSALFDRITRLPEYYPTRCERALLTANADAILASAGADTLVELGSGTSDKTRVLLAGLCAGGRAARYVPLDVDPNTLHATAKVLCEELPSLSVHAVVGDFMRHLSLLPKGGRRLVAFLGGTIGNLVPAERAEFFSMLRSTMAAGDSFLLGADLVKDRARLEAAYDDRAGLTAEFNRNALRVLNRELDGDLDVDAFDHVARWIPAAGWIEMRLRARRPVDARLAAIDLDVRFERGEDVLTEISAKFTPDGLAGELVAAGFEVTRSWRAGDDDFLLVLARPAG